MAFSIQGSDTTEEYACCVEATICKSVARYGRWSGRESLGVCWKATAWESIGTDWGWHCPGDGLVGGFCTAHRPTLTGGASPTGSVRRAVVESSVRHRRSG